jgi:hypothetical protein
MAALTETLIKIESICVHVDTIVFVFGIVYIIIGVLSCLTKCMNVFAILVSLVSIFIFDNPLFSKPEYCKSLTVLSHILVIGIAFRGLEQEDKHKEYMKVEDEKKKLVEEKKKIETKR